MANITVQFLGTGDAFSKKYGNTSALVFVENKGVMKKLLIDCGRTTPDDLFSLGYTWSDIDAIFITHLHGDHVGGLEEAGFFSRYILNRNQHLIFPHVKIKNDLWDKVLKGTMMNGDLDRLMTFEDYFTYEAVGPEEQFFFFNDVMFSVFPTYHIKNKKSYGVIIGEKDFIIYSGDSLLNQDLIAIGFADDCQAVFHDCALYQKKDMVHASLQDLLTLEPEWRENIYIMHYGDNLSDKYLEIKDAGLKIAVRGEKYHFEVGEYCP
jgi:ribonuclease BN (tRNA processing enzyme)